MFDRLRHWVFERFGLNAYVEGNYAVAEKYFRLLAAMEPHSILALHNMGIIRLAQKDYAGAEVFFREELERYGDSYPRLKTLADVLYLRGKRKAAGDFYTRSAAEAEAKNDLNLIEARIRICNDPEAFADARESLAMFEAGNDAQSRGDMETALARFERSAQLDPTSYLALNNAGTILLNVHHDKAAAKERFEHALALADLPSIRHNQATART